MTTTDKKSLTAYHEAGHACMYIFLFRKFKDATIIPDKKKGNLGSVTSSKGSRMDFYNMKIGRMIDKVMISLAGKISEEILLNKNISVHKAGAGGDYDGVADYVFSFMGGDITEQQLFMKWIYYRTKQTLKSRWNDVEKVANALIEKKTLTYQETVQILINQ